MQQSGKLKNSNMIKISKQDALDYHSSGRPGKIEVVQTKPHSTQYDLSLAYTPGVAQPCLEIFNNYDDVYKYTSKGNLVAVISNGTAVLGLGDIGPEAGKPVMEGKGLLFKTFADIDVFDIEVNEKDPQKLIEVVKAIAPTFGGINLEDIKAPECFIIEETLKKELNIPVFHDDQHGTAIISAAALLNAISLVDKRMDEIKVVVNGAGASAVACIKLYFTLGVRPENVVMIDSKGVLNRSRKDLNPVKMQFVTDRELNTLEEAMVGADMFLGLSAGNVVTPEMVQSMAPWPIVFAMANPDPEIPYDVAVAARPDIIMATGRSDYPNQVNNVLGFPFIFRGALDVRASTINEEMKIAAVNALALLAREDVPDIVAQAYNLQNLTFGKDYLIPKPMDPRLITTVAPAVARAAMESGVARKPITDWDEYLHQLRRRLGLDNKLIMYIMGKAQQNPKRVVFAEANNFKILKAAESVIREKIAHPILIGDKDTINRIIEENQLNIPDPEIVEIFDHSLSAKRLEFARILFEKRQRKGLTMEDAVDCMMNRDYFGAMMVETGEADAFISGFSRKYSDTIRPALHVIGVKPEHNRIAGMYIMIMKGGPLFLADTTVNIQPTAQVLVDIALLTAAEVRKFNIEPVIAFASFDNFGSYNGPGNHAEVRTAVKMLHNNYPDLIVDGEMQANYIFNRELRENKFPFSKLSGHDVNTIIFPDLTSGNILYKSLQELGTAYAIGPILMGMKKPVHILQMESSVREIVNMAAIAVVDAQVAGKK
jgi:malate dehydrogenase (oxaloacetate-decarboxylating)(NADP+)